MIDHPLSGVDAWVAYFSGVVPPVLGRTIAALAELRQREDDITGRDLSSAILHDPLMTLRVLMYLQRQHGHGGRTEITTIAHAVMMLGTTPFFKHFEQLAAVENAVSGWPAAREGLLRVMSRSRHAALLAREWSYYRHDIESDEVVIAALLHDLAEMLLWASAPALMLALRSMQENDRRLRSAEAQRHIFGFPLRDLQLALAREWRLPALLIQLMDSGNDVHPRVRNVLLAVDVARHLSHGWDDAGLGDDYAEVRRLLGINDDELRASVIRASVQAAHDWSWYGVPPALASLPGAAR